MLVEEHCPACDAVGLQPFLTRAAVPVHQNVVFPTRAAARAHPRGALDLAHCAACGFVTNRAFRAELISYDSDYENRQDCSPCFEAHMDSLVSGLVEAGVRGLNVVEVGCGQGAFLRRLCARGDNRGVGFDPAFRGPPDPDGQVRFVRSFYGAEQASVPADVVVCRHVIEHVWRPSQLLRAIRAALRASPHALVCFETPDLQWILDGQVSWDFFYEHCSYFTESALRTAVLRAGFEPTAVKRLFQGQYLWLEARPADEQLPAPARPDLAEGLVQFAAAERDFCLRGRQRLHELRRQGPVAAWGAGAKGATYLNLVDPDGELVDCVVDINPAKQQRYLPGTGHLVIGPDALVDRGVRSAVVLNPNYLEENRRLLASRDLDVSLFAPL